MSAHSLVMTEDLVRSIRRDVTVFALTRPVRLLAICATVVFLVLFAVLVSTDPAEHRSDEFWGPLSFVAVFLVVFVAALIASLVVAIHRGVRRALPVGWTFVFESGPELLHLETPQGTHDLRYSTYRSVHRLRSAVLLRLDGSRGMSILPRAALSDDDVAELERRITTARQPSLTARSV